MPDLRKDPVIDRWVIIATDRNKRPRDYPSRTIQADVDPQACQFCPGNEDKTPPEVLAYRQDGSPPNTPGWQVRVVPNKFPALRGEGSPEREETGVYTRMSGVGAHEVIIETPMHQQTFSNLSEQQVEQVLWSYRDRIVALRQDTRFRSVLVFKNHGQAAGATAAHTHSQLIALPIVPQNVAQELQGAGDYYTRHARCIYCDIVRQELAAQTRIVCENDSLVCLTPYASRFPFETWILPKRHAPSFEESPPRDLQALAGLLREALRRQDKILGSPAYNFFIHTLPFHMPHGGEQESYHWHLEMMPRLTYAAGFEWGAGFYMNPTTPEEAAQSLRDATVEA